MKITWHGHSCFTIATTAGVVAFDPYEDGRVPGYAPLAITADAVLCSHDHGDHNAVQVVRVSGRTTSYQIEQLDTFHDEQEGAKRGKNTIHILTAEGLRVAHLGDLGCEPTAEQLARLDGLDAVLLPVGGFYTIDAKQAKALVEKIKPRVVIPMHYRLGALGFDVIGELSSFLSLCDDVVDVGESSIELSHQTPQQTAVLTYQG